MIRLTDDRQQQYELYSNGISLQQYFEEKMHKMLETTLIQDIGDGDYNEYYEAYWEYIRQYDDGREL